MERRYDPQMGEVDVITTTPTPGALMRPAPPVIAVRPKLPPVVRSSPHAAGRTQAPDKAARAKAARQARRRARRAGR